MVSNELINSFYNYIFDNEQELLIGKLNKKNEFNNIYNIIETSDIINDGNLILNPKLLLNKEKQREKFMQLIEASYRELKNYNSFNYKNLYHLLFYFSRKETLNQNKKLNKNLISKIYIIFPNINFELTQIKNLSFNNTDLNKYLVSRNNNNLIEIKNDLEYKNGFLTMSENHRLIALKDDRKEKGGIKNSSNLKQIIFGIWINLKEEKSTPKKKDLEFLLEQNKKLIYEKCFEFIQLSDIIETIYSPSPKENIFLLVIFYYGIQCHYEVKVKSSEINKKNFNNDILINKWLIAKKKCEININNLFSCDFEFDLKNEIEKNSNINVYNDFICKKLGINQKSFFSKSLNNSKKNKSNISNCNSNAYKDNLNEIFHENINLDLEDDEDLKNIYYSNKPINLITRNIDNNKINKKDEENNMDGNNNDNNNKKTFKKKISGFSLESTNINSWKPSPFSSKNSNNNNNNEIISNPYSFIIAEQGEKIKNLENKVNKIENILKEILNDLDDDIKNHSNEKVNKYKRNKKNNVNFKYDDVNSSIKLVDQSIKVPHIIYKELSREDEE